MAKTAAKSVRAEVKIRPLSDRVLARRIEEEEQKVGGIIVPDTAKEKPQQATIVAAGPGRRTDEGELVRMEVKPGDRVLIGKYSGTEVQLEGEEYIILKESDILGILQ